MSTTRGVISQRIADAFYDVPVDLYVSYSGFATQLMMMGGFPLVVGAQQFEQFLPSSSSTGLNSIVGRVSRTYIPQETSHILRTEQSLIVRSRCCNYLVAYGIDPLASRIECRFYEGIEHPAAIEELFDAFKAQAKQMPLGFIFRQVSHW